MRIAIGLLCAALLGTGCAHHAPQSQSRHVIIKADLRVVGQVEMVNVDGRFVVVNYPPGSVPRIDRRLDVYRRGLKVGELKVTGPQRDNNTVADIITGEIQVNDETREE